MNDLKIKELRKKLGLTQEKLAELIGVSRNTIINYEKGGEIPAPKRQMLNSLYEQNAQNITSTNEPTATYGTNHDKVIAEHEEKIKEIKKEIAKWETKLEEDPDKGETYKKYISSYEEQIFLHNQIINITLEAKRDYLENSNE